MTLVAIRRWGRRNRRPFQTAGQQSARRPPISKRLSRENKQVLRVDPQAAVGDLTT